MSEPTTDTTNVPNWLDLLKLSIALCITPWDLMKLVDKLTPNEVRRLMRKADESVSMSQCNEMLARLEEAMGYFPPEKKESDTPEKQRGGYEPFNPPAYWGPAYEKAKESE